MNRLNDSAFNIAVLQTAGISNIIQQLVKIYLKKPRKLHKYHVKIVSHLKVLIGDI